MRENDKKIYRECRELFSRVFDLTLQVSEETRRCNDVEELADRALAMREASKYIDQLGKELRRCQRIASSIACMIWAKDAELNPENLSPKISTEYVHATPDIKMSLPLPKMHEQPAEYKALMAELGVPEEYYNTEKGWEVLRVHWPGFTEYVTHLYREGKPLPAGIDPHKQKALWQMKLYKRKDIIDEQ